MLNKELLLLTTEDQPAGSIKLTVGYGDDVIGYSILYDEGSVSRRPIWNFKGQPVAIMDGLVSFTYNRITALMFKEGTKADARSITVTVVEKGLTITLSWDGETYSANTRVFDPSDEGKTFTIVFEPEPTGYV